MLSGATGAPFIFRARGRFQGSVPDSAMPFSVAVLSRFQNRIRHGGVLGDLKVEHANGGEIGAVFERMVESRLGSNGPR